MKTLNKLFPLLDHLYIFQNFEYEMGAFLKWFLSHPLKRNLQRKHRLDLTAKAWLLLVLSLLLIVVAARILSSLTSLGYITFGLSLLALGQVAPFFLIVSQLLLWPFEYYSKQKIIKAAKKKRSGLNKLEVVAIVGSFAKTSTKEMLYTLLWKDFRVVKTPKSYNTAVSIARSILADVKPNTDIFLVEMDAYHPGDIADLCQLAQPTSGVITAIAPQHLERFGAMEKLAKAQFEVSEYLSKVPDSLIYLNADDEWTLKLEGSYQLNKGFFGMAERANYSAKNIQLTGDWTEFELETPEGIIKIKLPLVGEHHVSNFLAAAALANQLGLSLKQIQPRALQILPTPHRLEIRHQGQVTIIDNTYNTNPVASKASLNLLRNYSGSKKIIITPGLVELGKSADEENQLFAQNMASVADEIIIVGQNAKLALMRGLRQSDYPKEHVQTVTSTQEALTRLASWAIPGAVVLLENDLPDQYF